MSFLALLQNKQNDCGLYKKDLGIKFHLDSRILQWFPLKKTEPVFIANAFRNLVPRIRTKTGGISIRG